MKLIQVLDYNTFGGKYIDTALKAAEYADIIWLRIKNREDIRQKAEELKKALPDKYLSLSLRADIAAELCYSSVQLGSGCSTEEVRKKYPKLQIGYSAHSLEEIIKTDADYFTLSPIFHTVKNYEIKPLGAVDVSHVDKKIYALGGISSENIKLLKNCGFEGAAGISFYKELEKIANTVC